MSNIEISIIETTDEKVVEIIKEDKRQKYLDFDINEDSICIRARSGYIYKLMKKIAKELKDTLIEVSISCDAERYDKLYKLKFFNGEYYLFDVILQYNIAYDTENKDLLEETKKGLFDEVSRELESLCQRMDYVNVLDGDRFEMDRNEDKKITIELEKKGLNIKAIKEGPSLTLKSVEPAPILIVKEGEGGFDDLLGIPF